MPTPPKRPVWFSAWALFVPALLAFLIDDTYLQAVGPAFPNPATGQTTYLSTSGTHGPRHIFYATATQATVYNTLECIAGLAALMMFARAAIYTFMDKKRGA
jgi:hypothetical protein